MVQTTHLWEGDDGACREWLYGSRLWTILVEREMSPTLVMILNIGRQHTAQVTLIEDDDVIEAFAADPRCCVAPCLFLIKCWNCQAASDLIFGLVGSVQRGALWFHRKSFGGKPTNANAWQVPRAETKRAHGAGWLNDGLRVQNKQTASTRPCGSEKWTGRSLIEDPRIGLSANRKPPFSSPGAIAGHNFNLEFTLVRIAGAAGWRATIKVRQQATIRMRSLLKTSRATEILDPFPAQMRTESRPQLGVAVLPFCRKRRAVAHLY